MEQRWFRRLESWPCKPVNHSWPNKGGRRESALQVSFNICMPTTARFLPFSDVHNNSNNNNNMMMMVAKMMMMLVMNENEDGNRDALILSIIFKGHWISLQNLDKEYILTKENFVCCRWKLFYVFTLVLLKFKMHINHERIILKCCFKNNPTSDPDSDRSRSTL